MWPHGTLVLSRRVIITRATCAPRRHDTERIDCANPSLPRRVLVPCAGAVQARPRLSLKAPLVSKVQPNEEKLPFQLETLFLS